LFILQQRLNPDADLSLPFDFTSPLYPPRSRSAHNVSEVMNLIGDVRGKIAVLVDDMIDTAGTITNAAKVRNNSYFILKVYKAEQTKRCKRIARPKTNTHCAII
jgi:hypoxanthine-guanine phosphoribosyltransferase